jgi:signal transduction histidine kinase
LARIAGSHRRALFFYNLEQVMLNKSFLTGVHFLKNPVLYFYRWTIYRRLPVTDSYCLTPDLNDIMEFVAHKTISKAKEENTLDSDELDKIAHDIRSSVNIIVGYTQLMLDQTTGRINVQQRRALQDILKSSTRLHDLTDAVIRRLDAVSGKKI